ncbi:MAG: glycosyltransferase [FCB group bacterium]
MAERTVLIIAYYFPPMGLSGVQRTLKFVKYLPENGWKPVVLTTAPTSFYAFDDTLDDDLRNEEIYIYRTAPKSADDLQSPKILKFRSYFIQRLGRAFLQTIYQPDRFIKWKKSALLLSEKIFAQHKIDVVFATAPPFTDFILAQEISKKFNVPFVADYRDLWVDNPYHFYATPFHKNYSIKLEKELLTTAEKIVVVTRHSKEVMLKRYGFLSHNDIAIIPHVQLLIPAYFRMTEHQNIFLKLYQIF